MHARDAAKFDAADIANQIDKAGTASKILGIAEHVESNEGPEREVAKRKLEKLAADMETTEELLVEAARRVSRHEEGGQRLWSALEKRQEARQCRKEGKHRAFSLVLGIVSKNLDDGPEVLTQAILANLARISAVEEGLD